MKKGMPNYYAMLGVKRDATPQQIQQAYRRRALEAHPDKGGSAEQMGLLAEARDRLINRASREQFNKDWRAFMSTAEEAAAEPAEISGMLTSTAERFSQPYKRKHAEWVLQYRSTPLEAKKGTTFFNPFNPKTVAAQEAKAPAPAVITHLTDTLNPEEALELFIHFLQGNYRGPVLADVKNRFSINIAAQRILNENDPDLLFYE
ncbi:MAG TPA: J domain-containing protein, partial [Coxiellaceae bacterium]|nr:J domain-containing protein [Coxiellaceae bacterium]